MNGTNYHTNYGEGYSQMSLTEKLRAESNAEEITAEEKTVIAENVTPQADIINDKIPPRIL